MTSAPKVCPRCGLSCPPEDLFCPRDRSPLRSAAPDDDLLGSIVGDRYLLSERIGAGGMGEVFKAQDVRLQRPAAVKLLRAHLVTDLDALARFGREASNAARINDPHVVQVYDFGETEQRQPFIAMELVPGESLGAVLRREGRLEPARAVAIVAQIAAGLDAAHRLGIVHRDLKPDNVLLAPAADGGELAKVSDFGISKAFADESQQITTSGVVTGTCEYMSPEQVLGRPLDRRSDVYALGLVAFRLLTGELPFACDTAEQSMMLRLSQAPRRLAEAAPGTGWPDGLQAVFDRVLASEADARHPTAGTFAEELAAALRPPGRGTPPPSRRRRRVPIAALTLAGVVGALWYGGGWLRSQPSDRDTVETGRADDERSVDTSTRIVLAPPPPSAPAALTPDSALPSVPAQPPARDTTLETRPTKPAPPPTVSEKESGAARDSVTVAPAPVQPADAAGRERLARLRRTLHPELPGDSVALVLKELAGVVPSLRTTRDSVDAAILQAEAYGMLERYEDACALLDGVRRAASPRQLEKIRLWADRGLCAFSNWSDS